jgi:diguanylate cyclase (GGDEF)-like protein
VETVWQGEQAFLVTLHDITDRRRAEETMDRLAGELKQANERLARLVSTDHLTEVLNRRGVEQALGVELRRMRRSGEGLVAVLVDYDNFKNINDAYGYAVGDAALRALTKAVNGALRAGDHLGRVGGDEFLVLLPGATLDEGFAVAEKLRRTIKGSTLPVADGSVVLSASLAVGSVDQHVVSLEEVLASVNGALKKSKVEGRDRVSGNRPTSVGDPRAEPSRSEDFDVNVIDLGTALQAILRVDTEEVVGFEALTRGPSGSYAAPSDLFRAAFERNVLTTLDLRALAASLRVLGLNDEIATYHVNLFPSTILSAPMERISGLLAEAGGAGRLCVELSEQQFLGDPTYLREPLAMLRRSGIRVAIDDVGFGRSSIEALLVLEPDIVKIDRSCVQSIDSDPDRRSQLRRLIGMLSSIGTEVIVEGVETRAELGVLRDMGVRYGQGFLWGRPARAMTV